MAKDSIRAFLALEIDEHTRRRLAGIVADLRPALRGLRWVPVEQLHLTLRFLGDASAAALERLTPLLLRAAAACPPADVAATELGAFPERGSPRVLWLGLQLPAEILRLQRACEEAAVSVGFARETRPFRAHLTLGRWRERDARPVLAKPDLPAIELRRLVLFRSALRPSGAIHTPMAVHALGSATP